MQAVTIDPAHAMDLDDALWVDEHPLGWRVLVAIANAAKLVRKGTTADLQARTRRATRYFASGSKPMLVRRLSEGEGSLLPGEERAVLAVRFFVTRDGAVQAPVIGATKLVSLAKLAYEDVPLLLGEDGPYRAMLSAAERCATVLLERRRQAGALALYDLNHGWMLTEEGWLRQIADKRTVIGQIIVQEMMIAANCAFADFARSEGVPILFRNHRAQAGASSHARILDFLAEALAKPVLEIEDCRRMLGHALERARYNHEPDGHFGLNVPAYTHASSPLRRYADLVTQRQLFAYVMGNPLPYSAGDLDELAAEINSFHEAEREARHVHEKTKADRKAQQMLTHPSSLDGIEGKDLERAVKVLVRAGGDLPASARGLFGRPLAPLPTALVLVGSTKLAPGWLDVRRAMLATLDGPTAVMVLACAAQQPELGVGPFTPAIEQVQCDPACFRVRATIVQREQPYHADLRGFSTKKAAGQAAALVLLHLLAGVEPPRAPAALDKPPVPGKTPAPLPIDPISAVHVLATRRGLAAPVFSAEMSGPPHAPVFTATVVFSGQRFVGSASGKQEAKREACRQCLAAVGET